MQAELQSRNPSRTSTDGMVSLSNTSNTSISQNPHHQKQSPSASTSLNTTRLQRPNQPLMVKPASQMQSRGSPIVNSPLSMQSPIYGLPGAMGSPNTTIHAPTQMPPNFSAQQPRHNSYVSPTSTVASGPSQQQMTNDMNSRGQGEFWFRSYQVGSEHLGKLAHSLFLHNFVCSKVDLSVQVRTIHIPV